MSNNTILFALYRLGYKGPHDRPRFSRPGIHDAEDEHIELQLAHQKRNKVAAAYSRKISEAA